MRGNPSLLDEHPDRRRPDLIHSDGSDRIGACRVIEACECFWIDPFPKENVQHFALAELAVPHELALVKVELSFPIAPITIVRQNPGCELRVRLRYESDRCHCE